MVCSRSCITSSMGTRGSGSFRLCYHRRSYQQMLIYQHSAEGLHNQPHTLDHHGKLEVGSQGPFALLPVRHHQPVYGLIHVVNHRTLEYNINSPVYARYLQDHIPELIYLLSSLDLCVNQVIHMLN